MSWQPIETAPKDGTRIIGWSSDYGARETASEPFLHGSLAYEKCIDGGRFWSWDEPQSNWRSFWHPTHWMQLPEPPK